MQRPIPNAELITEASGSVGSTLEQLAKRLEAKEIATASEQNNNTFKQLGADVLSLRNTVDLTKLLKQETGRETIVL